MPLLARSFDVEGLKLVVRQSTLEASSDALNAGRTRLLRHLFISPVVNELGAPLQKPIKSLSDPIMRKPDLQPLTGSDTLFALPEYSVSGTLISIF